MRTLRLAMLAAILSLPAAALAQSQGQATPGEPWKSALSDDVPFKLGGYFWVDTGYMERDNTQSSFPDKSIPYMQGRFGLLAAYEKTVSDVTLRAEAEFLALEDEWAGSRYEPHILSSFLSIGQQRWDVQIGRFLNSEVYYRGQGIELYTPDEFGASGGVPIDRLDTTRRFQNQPGQLRVHYRPGDAVMLEVAGIYGFETSQKVFGVRPMLDARWAGFRLFAGLEWLDKPTNTPEFKTKTNMWGYAARLQYHLPFAVIGANYSHKEDELFDNNEDLQADQSGPTTSIGGFADVNLGKTSTGFGFHYTEFTTRTTPEKTSSQNQGFVSFLYRMPWDGFSVKAVAGFARATNRPPTSTVTYENDLYSFRVRIAYDFM
jgi:hypothetical protein